MSNALFATKALLADGWSSSVRLTLQGRAH